MGWASSYIARLQKGETVSFRPRGNSMSGKIESGQLCTVVPVEPATVEVGDIVLCKVHGREYLHLVKAIQGQRFQIGNNRGHVNGWVSAKSIYGKCTAVGVENRIDQDENRPPSSVQDAKTCRPQTKPVQ
jgi:hypothetical protein